MLLCYGSILRYKITSQAFITCSRKGDWRHSRQADKNGLVQVRREVLSHCMIHIQTCKQCLTMLHCIWLSNMFVHVLKCTGPRLHHHRAVQGEAAHREGGSPSTQGVPSQVSRHDSTAAIQFVYESDYPDLM